MMKLRCSHKTLSKTSCVVRYTLTFFMVLKIGYFNRSMRLWASRVFGFTLNEHGLFDRGDGTTRVFEASTEREVFDRLGLVYREPHERHCWDALEPIDANIKPNLQLTQSELKVDNKNKWVE